MADAAITLTPASYQSHRQVVMRMSSDSVLMYRADLIATISI